MDSGLLYAIKEEPVAVCADLTDSIWGNLIEVVHELVQVCPVALYRCDITVHFPHSIGANDACIFPSRISKSNHAEVRCNIAEHPGIVLRILNEVDKPFGVERCDVAVERSSLCKDLRIAGPSSTLIALWTVCRYIEVVPPLSPVSVQGQAVKEWVIGCKLTCLWKVGVVNDCLNIFSSWSIIDARDFNILKTMEGKDRLANGLAILRKCVGIGRLCCPEVGGVEGAIRV